MRCLFWEEQFETRFQTEAVKQPLQPLEDFRSEQSAATFQTNWAELLFVFFFVCLEESVWEFGIGNKWHQLIQFDLELCLKQKIKI